ncbi:ABC transporter permease subunit [Mycoplasma mycoides subsp. mycoides]|uniref:Binding--dependent transport system inner membrane component family protein n=1 Tax=Mycoplasma mycoides subsp. mycoides TaxID=2103 RepID=A0AAE2EJ90_MYCMY|nr:ABC transporter permease subunit [Mycoplasma mycoides]ADK69883.1 ABC transporter, permease protein [Mycoplasma mycoides subsp. mycoides SC str. Gladysdale]AIZ55660.1 phosphonate ABC transporter, permease protein PhnE [Mycoplasma mycoides subsp. mycoides]KJQ46475.1 binding--dependent transport system inner membrane component family protein [Mycoplasma mycoides subsp. mycoides]KJQ46790.1 binding--dependent transport system inner membrane component family protein [Mycoplasma mycoides subsp. myc
MATRQNYKKPFLVKESNFFKYRYINRATNTKTSWKFHPIYFHLLSFLVLVLVGYCFYNQASLIKIDNFYQVAKKLVLLFSFENKNFLDTSYISNEYTNLFLDTLSLLWVTIKLALTGTFIGFILAVITSFLSFSKVNNKFFSYLLSAVILILRSTLELIFITLITSTFRNDLSLLLVYIWFTWLWLHKYYIDMLNSFDLQAYYVSISQGNSKFKAFFKEIYPRIKNRVIALFIFSFESNIRWASILAALSLPGIGRLIVYGSENTAHFNQLGIPLLVLMSFILVLELLNYLFKKYLVEARSKVYKQKNETKLEYYTRLSKKLNVNKIIISLIFISLTIISIITFINIPIYIFNLDYVKSFFNNLLNPNFASFSIFNKHIENNPILLIWNSLQFTIVAMFICIVITIIGIRLQSIRLNNLFIVIICRSLNVLIRLIPTIVYFYVFHPIFSNVLTLLIIVVSLHQASSKAKQLVEVIDNLNIQIINNLKIQGYSNNQIFLKYVLPAIKIEFISLSIFYFELIFRASITYYILASDKLYIGYLITKYLDTKAFYPRLAMSYVWIATFAILTINLIARYVNKKIRKSLDILINYNLEKILLLFQ